MKLKKKVINKIKKVITIALLVFVTASSCVMLDMRQNPVEAKSSGDFDMETKTCRITLGLNKVMALQDKFVIEKGDKTKETVTLKWAIPNSNILKKTDDEGGDGISDGSKVQQIKGIGLGKQTIKTSFSYKSSGASTNKTQIELKYVITVTENGEGWSTNPGEMIEIARELYNSKDFYQMIDGSSGEGQFTQEALNIIKNGYSFKKDFNNLPMSSMSGSFNECFAFSMISESGSDYAGKKGFAKNRNGGINDYDFGIGAYQFTITDSGTNNVADFFHFCVLQNSVKYNTILGRYMYYSNDQIYSNYQGVESAWREAYKADPDDFTKMQDTYFYNHYVAPPFNTLKKKGFDPTKCHASVQGLLAGMFNVRPKFQNELLSIAPNLSNSMSAVEQVNVICDAFISKLQTLGTFFSGWSSRWGKNATKDRKWAIEYINKYPDMTSIYK